MALVREPMVLYDGFDADAASGFDAMAYCHDALLGGVDAAALFGGGAYAEPAGASASAYVPDATSWGSAGATSSVLAFDRAAGGNGAQAATAATAAAVVVEEEDCDAWIDAMDDDDQGYGSPKASIGFDPASGCFSLTQRSGGARRPFGLLFPNPSSGSPDAAAAAAGGSQKRPYRDHARMQGAEPQATTTNPAKKQCGASRKTSKPKPAAPTTSPNKDPQSLAAKNRRERISERLRTLQELVPNGTKVDMVTMLEKAISYVKFLQLQVKVLATDEFWPAQGGRAPEISQVKDALDAILSSSSQRGQLN